MHSPCHCAVSHQECHQADQISSSFSEVPFLTNTALSITCNLTCSTQRLIFRYPAV